ncbi:MAG: hypothetical protein D8M58_20950 [Calditrichaeota bacterium]|nr:MAG: hypothetical protein DWQ03_16665 [Calditrichota bacterium]MBL1207880.1 hypothetical protein [Calditrichota bacterium]NOG47715.1 prolyl oligopeptidase family serine peptidase [Calditrichota bacterium]
MLIKSTTIKITSIILITIFIGCSEESSTQSKETYERGEIIESKNLQTYSVNEIQFALTLFGITEDMNLQYPVKAVSITYQTSDVNGKLIEASGALLVPVSSSVFPLLSIQHGTETKRTSVASVSAISSIEGVSGLITGSKGYVTCVPDYPGFGVSTEIHPYVHAKSLAISVIDFLVAAKNYCADNNIVLNEQLFLGGYSEGGYATLATQKEIEQKYSQFNITAVAPMAGPYDLLGTADLILQKTEYQSPTYIAYLFTAYDEIYQWDRLDDIFTDAYSGRMHNFFDGSMSYSEINNELPTTISLLLKDDFITGFLNRTDTTVIATFQENTLLDWTPFAPIRFFHGDADETVPFQNALTAKDTLLTNGATQIELVTIEGGTHSTAGLPAVLGMIEWFDSFQSLP